MRTIATPQPGEQPVLLLDVEGVFLLLDDERPEEAPSEGCLIFEPAPPNYYRPEHGQLLKKILPEVDPYWFTGVEPERVEQLESVLALPSTPFVDFFAVHGRQQKTASRNSLSPREDALHYKREAADYLFPGRNVAWLDDWFVSYDFKWAEERVSGGADTLLIRTDYKKGLEPEHIGRIKLWSGGLAMTEDSI